MSGRLEITEIKTRLGLTDGKIGLYGIYFLPAVEEKLGLIIKPNHPAGDRDYPAQLRGIWTVSEFGLYSRALRE